MTQKRNRRTLKRRIRKAISWSIFISIFLFGAVILYFGAHIFKSEARLVSQYISRNAAQNLNSEVFRNAMGITDLKDLDIRSEKYRRWVKAMRKAETEKSLGSFRITLEEAPHPGPDLPEHNPFRKEAQFKFREEKTMDFTGIQDMVVMRIVLQEKEIYKSARWNEGRFMDDLMQDMQYEEKTGFRYSVLQFLDTEMSSPLYDSNNQEIGKVITKVNDYFMLFIFAMLVTVIVITALILLIATNLISRFFTIPITTPITQLEEKIRSVAAGDFNSTVNTQITLKRPLREIESLMESTNVIMNKMSHYNKQLDEHRQQLEEQNNELEAQNEELSESKRQIEEAQSQLVQSENMASVGQLTAAITHEINTPLGAISSNVQMCDMILGMMLENPALGENEELRSSLVQLKEANWISLMGCERVNQIIKSLKNFSKLDQADFQEADINEGIRSVLVLTSNLWKRKVTLHEEYGTIPLVKCYPGLLNQVLMNIVVNAIQSIQDNGDLHIHTWHADNAVFVSIRDSGSGIRPENLDRIFEPGFTTKKEGSLGMGLGLSICRNIVQKHHGDIQVSSEVGKGTEFVVRIPLGLTKECCEGSFKL